jgi:SanA protein
MLKRGFTFLRKRFIHISLIGLWLFVSALFLSDYWVKKVAHEYLYQTVESIPKNRVGVVLGTSKYVSNGNINQYYQFRIDAAVALFYAGKIDFILVSGDNRVLNYNEPEQMRADLLARGIPDDKIFLDYAGFRTLDSMVRAQKVFGQNKFTVISQKFHNERALFIGRKKGMDVIGFNAREVGKRYGFKTNLRERFAKVKVILDLAFGKKPKFLGEPIHID